MLAVEGQYHTPPIDEINMDFLRDVLAGRKLLIKLSDLCQVNVPRIREFDCNMLYKQAMGDETARRYLPEPTPEGKRTIGRKFLFNSKFV